MRRGREGEKEEREEWRGRGRKAASVLLLGDVHVTLPVAPVQLMRPGIGRNASCASGDWLTSRPKGCSQPRELWFFDILMYIN